MSNIASPLHLKFDVLIAGGGFAGAYCAKYLSLKLGRKAGERVALIADENVLVFQPMLAEVVGASLSPMDVVTPLREFCREANVFQASIAGIDLAQNRVELNSGNFTPNSFIEYNHLVLALGNVVDQSKVPGLSEHGFGLKDAWDALRLRSSIIQRLEEANLATDPNVKRRLLTFVVVGGGYSGVETAGQILDLIEEVKKLYLNLAKIPHRVVLVHSRDFLLPEIGKKLGQYAEKKLRERGMEILLNERVTSITSRQAFLGNGSSIDTHLVISTVGNASNPLVAELCKTYDLPNVKGRVSTEPSMQVVGHPNIWALGDCAAVPLGKEPSCPPTAQFALRQGIQASANILRVLEQKPTRPFRYTSQGQLAAIGHRTAVADVMGVKFSGIIAWFIWRTIYLSKIPGLERKVRVMVDWTLDLFFSRNISLLRPESRALIQKMWFAQGDLIFQENDPYLSFYIIQSGQVQLFKSGTSAINMSAGDTLGGKECTEKNHWNCHAVATEPSQLICVQRSVMDTLLASKEIARRLQIASNPT